MKVIIDNRTKIIVDKVPEVFNADSIYLTPDYSIIDIDNPFDEDNNFKQLSEDELETVLPFSSTKSKGLAKVNDTFEEEVALITRGIPVSEILTWSKQEQEARAYLLDRIAPTPLIDSICLTRECDKSYLVSKILEKADAYAVAVGMLTGIRQRLEKEISGE